MLSNCQNVLKCLCLLLKKAFRFFSFMVSPITFILIYFSFTELLYPLFAYFPKILISTSVAFFFQAIFQRYPRPEKEYQSFSLLYNDRSLDLVSIFAVYIFKIKQI